MLRTKILGTKMREAERAARPDCLVCHQPINIKYAELPHGYMHKKCEAAVVITPQQLHDKVYTLPPDYIDVPHNDDPAATAATEA